MSQSSQRPIKPILQLKAAVDDLIQYFEQTQGKEAGEMYLGSDIFIIRLRQTSILEGEWEGLDRTIDLFDLIAQMEWQEGSDA